MDCCPLEVSVVADGEIPGRVIQPFGLGGDRYTLEVDAEHGVLLSATATVPGH
jgi:hypothetical protein